MCPACFTLYPNKKDSPLLCNHPSLPVDKTDSGKEDDDECTNDSSDDQTESSRCGTQLFRANNRQRPFRSYGYTSLKEWIARLLSRPGIEKAIDETRRKSQPAFDPQAPIRDIHESKAWKTFQGPDGQIFTAGRDNLTFGMFVDAINPYGNRQAGKHASITFLIMTCLTLPFEMRGLPENIFLVGIVPGPKEPSLDQINSILQPIVDQLQEFWNPGVYISQTHDFKYGRRIFAALLPFFADLPALRRALGFASPTATRMCSYCLLKRKDITNLDPKTWKARSLSEHFFWANQYREAKTVAKQKELLHHYGVRYSVLLQLEYWDITRYHVVDAMHNLLLGLLAWHCRRFWAMSDTNDEPEPAGVPSRELIALLRDAQGPVPAFNNCEHPIIDLEDNDDVQTIFGTHTAASDTAYPPSLSGLEWRGQWTASTEGKVILDSDALGFINTNLPLIHVPTWIKRAVPVLGKASFGRLKADEWRNLFSIQLPLILPAYWCSHENQERSLLHNFFHLVCAVNCALKRTITVESIASYRHHIHEYLQSSSILFEDVKLAPNHHMAMHLADCLEMFGPVRSWWSFPMERLMGTILKACHNNRLGQLEMTFMNTFNRIGNLRALLSSPDKLPEALQPFLTSLQDPSSSNLLPETHDLSKTSQMIDSALYKQLVGQLNAQCPSDDGCKWMASSEWSRKTLDQRNGFATVSNRIEPLHHLTENDITYSTFKKNPSNSMIAAKLRSGEMVFGRIDQIFKHRRVNLKKEFIIDSWLVIEPLPPAPPFSDNPFAQLSQYDVQLHLRLDRAQSPQLLRLQQVVANCAWISYASGALSEKFKGKTVALIVLDR